MYKGKIVNWDKFNIDNPESCKQAMGAIHYFMTAPDRVPDLKTALRAKGQFYTLKGDFPAEIQQVLEKYHAIDDFDEGWQEIFDVKDFTGTKESGFEIYNVQSGLTFSKVKTGEKIKVHKIYGDKVTVNFDRYGGALAYDLDWFADSKYWLIEDNTIEFRNKAYQARAAAYYALIEALSSSTDIAWQTPTPSALPNTDAQYTTIRDVNTIQAACDAILTAVKDKGYAVTPQSPFIILAPHVLRPRVNAAISKLNQAFSGSSQSLTYNVKPIYSLMLSNNTDYYVILPKRKLKAGLRLDLTILNFTHIMAWAETIAGCMRFGGALGDTAQLRRCKTS
jgi:hypothetical protein